jgi:hypothetical protein
LLPDGIRKRATLTEELSFLLIRWQPRWHRLAFRDRPPACDARAARDKVATDWQGADLNRWRMLMDLIGGNLDFLGGGGLERGVTLGVASPRGHHLSKSTKPKNRMGKSRSVRLRFLLLTDRFRICGIKMETDRNRTV